MLDPGAAPKPKAAASAAAAAAASGTAPGSGTTNSTDEEMVPTTVVRPGDVLRVLPGERIPVDGAVIEGRCSVDESMMTGESR